MTILTKQLLVVVIILLVLFMGALGILLYHKMFKKIIVKEGAFRPLNFAYTFHKGDYQKNMLILEDVMKALQEASIPVVSPATIYYDNPRKTKRFELRSDVGFIVPDSVTHIEADNIQLKAISHKKYIYSAFPYKSRFSIMIGAMRVYPAFKKRLKKLGKPEREMIEIYEIQNKTIIYLMPIED